MTRAGARILFKNTQKMLSRKEPTVYLAPGFSLLLVGRGPPRQASR